MRISEGISCFLVITTATMVALTTTSDDSVLVAGASANCSLH